MSNDTTPGEEDLRDVHARLKNEIAQLADAEQTREAAAAFAREVREQLIRARGSMKQGEVARGMGLRHQSRVSRIENSDGDLTLEALYRYAKAVGYTPRIELVPDTAEASDAFQAQEASAMMGPATQAPGFIGEALENMQEQIKALQTFLEVSTASNDLRDAFKQLNNGQMREFMRITQRLKSQKSVSALTEEEWRSVFRDVMVQSIRPEDPDETPGEPGHNPTPRSVKFWSHHKNE